MSNGPGQLNSRSNTGRMMFTCEPVLLSSSWARIHAASSASTQPAVRAVPLATAKNSPNATTAASRKRNASRLG